MKPSLPGLSQANLGRELGAGVTLLALAVPLNIGYAQIAGLPATAGLYALIVPSIAFALIGSSRQLVAAPDAAAAALVASSLMGLASLGSVAYAQMAMAQAILCAVIFTAMSIFRLGFLADFLSEPILNGFVAGLALEILVGQVAKMLGIGREPGAEFLGEVVHVVTELPDTHRLSAVVGLGSIVVLLLGRRWLPVAPWALVVLVLATAATSAWSLDARGISVLGPVEGGLPRLTWPSLSWSEWRSLLPSALALTFVSVAEGLLVARNYSRLRRYPNEPDRDLLGLGAANLGAGITGCFTVGASVSRTAAMDQAGSRTQLPGLVVAAGGALLLVAGTDVLERIPSPAIGAVVALAVAPLLHLGYFRRLARIDRFELAIATTCLLGTVLFGPITGIGVAFVLSLVNVARRAAHPPLHALDSDGRPAWSLYGPGGPLTLPGRLDVRLAGPLFFANGARVEEALHGLLRESHPVAGLAELRLDVEAVTDVDTTAAEGVRRVIEEAEARSTTVRMVHVDPLLEERLRTLGLLDLSGLQLGDDPDRPPHDAQSDEEPEGDHA